MASKGRTGLQSIRRLEALDIEHALVAFDPAIRSGAAVAEAANEDPGAVYKTLVVLDTRPGTRPLLAIVPSDRELDLKLLAKHMSVKKLVMASHAEAERLTGLRVGGISALALLDRGWQVFLDASAEERTAMLVSAGQRGFDVRLAPSDFRRVTGARVVPLAT